VRYKQTVIGLAWAFVRPFVTMVVFTVVFGKLARLPTEGSSALCSAGLRGPAALDARLVDP
jgi:ABC-type polysaccharide/polyol phosphate export permease